MVEIVIVEKDLNYCKNLINSINLLNKNIRISFITNDIKEILNISNGMDILIVNYEFIKQIRNYNLKDCRIIYVSDNPIENKTKSLTVIPKDKINLITKKVETLSDHISDHKLEGILAAEIDFLDYNFSHTGTLCLIETMKILYKTTEHYFETNLERDIYPTVAKKFHLTPHSVKGNIIYATSKMLDECDKPKLCKYLGFNVSKSPGSKTIMCTILEKIKFEI